MNSHISIQSLFSLQVPSVKTKAHALLRVTTTSNQQDAKMLLFPNHVLPPLYYYQGTNALSNLPYMSLGNKVRTASSNRGLCWSSNLSTASHTQEKMERARKAHRGEDQNDPEYRALLFTVQLATPAIWEPRPVHETAASHPCALPESPTSHQISDLLRVAATLAWPHETCNKPPSRFAHQEGKRIFHPQQNCQVHLPADSSTGGYSPQHQLLKGQL